jgi:hypothetical protein
MQLSGTVTTAAVQGVTTTAPADVAYTQGFSPVGAGTSWALQPDGVTAIATLPTTTSGAHTPNVDWSTAGIFLITFGNNSTFTFSNVTVGQTITIVITQNATGSMTGTFPAGCVFVGGSKTLSTAASAIDTVEITCTAVGTYLCQLLKAYA